MSIRISIDLDADTVAALQSAASPDDAIDIARHNTCQTVVDAVAALTFRVHPTVTIKEEPSENPEPRETPERKPSIKREASRSPEPETADEITAPKKKKAKRQTGAGRGKKRTKATPSQPPNPPPRSTGNADDGMQGEYQIFVKTTHGTTITLHVNRTTTVRRLRQLISEREGFSIDGIGLIYAGKQLEEELTVRSEDSDDEGREELTLERYGIQKESTLHLVIRLRGS